MILLLCTACLEAFSIHEDREKSCRCGKTFGRHAGSLIVVSPYALPIGISNASLRRGREGRLEEGWGHVLEAMVLPRNPKEFSIILDHRDLLNKAQQEQADERDKDVPPPHDGGSPDS